MQSLANGSYLPNSVVNVDEVVNIRLVAFAADPDPWWRSVTLILRRDVPGTAGHRTRIGIYGDPAPPTIANDPQVLITSTIADAPIGACGERKVVDQTVDAATKLELRNCSTPVDQKLYYLGPVVVDCLICLKARCRRLAPNPLL